MIFVGKTQSSGRQTAAKCSAVVYNDLREYGHHWGIVKRYTAPLHADFGDFRNFTETPNVRLS